MKRIAFYIFPLLGLLALASCEKDETRAVLSENPTGPAITSPSSGTSKVLTNADSAKSITFTWTAADFGFPAGVNYVLQMDKAGNNFKDPLLLAATTSTSASVNIYDLDNKMLANGYPEDVAAQVEIRVRAIIYGINSSTFTDTVFSAPITMTITPYLIIVNYPKLWVPGSYCGWDHSKAEFLYSVKSDNKYQGYIWFPDETTEFKLTKVAGWEQDNTIGDPDASGTSGTLKIGDWGGNNIKVSGGPGYFKINADLNEATYSWMKTEWGIIGSATADGWNSDQNMTYDVANKVWTATLDLVQGEIKFRANDSWDLNYGDDGADGKLDQNGANIAIPEAGNYTITLNLSQAIYKYKIKKN